MLVSVAAGAGEQCARIAPAALGTHQLRRTVKETRDECEFTH
jgi:hypothetical protein